MQQKQLRAPPSANLSLLMARPGGVVDVLVHAKTSCCLWAACCCRACVDFQGAGIEKPRCKGLRWVGKDKMPEQCKNSALAGAAYCGVHLKSLPYGDIDRPKAHMGCPLYLPTTPVDSGIKFWKGFQKKLKEQSQPTPPVPDPVGFLFEKILQAASSALPNCCHLFVLLQKFKL